MRSEVASRPWPLRVAGCVLLATLAGCARPPVAPAVVSAIPAGAARIWFYRDYEPSVSLNLATVELNGIAAGSVQPDGSAFYRDVSPGHYRISVESYGTDVHQVKDIDIAPGQEGFVKILALSSWESGGDKVSYQRDTFYVSLVSPQVARLELANHPLGGG